MMNQETPLRGEVSDIGYSILDGVDGVVLGDTTAEGLYGEQSTEALSRCIAEAEKTIDYKQCFTYLRKSGKAA